MEQSPELDDLKNSLLPEYDMVVAQLSMTETLRLTNSIKNINTEDDDWELRVNKIGWNTRHLKLFANIVKTLDCDRMARLAGFECTNEPVLRRVLIDKSADRFRRILAGISWDQNTTQWLHNILMDCLPPSYLAAYLDIMQTLKMKLPSLVDKMIFWKQSGNINQDLLAPILKHPWQPMLSNKYRKLPGQPLIVIVPSVPRLSAASPRTQKLLPLFATMAAVLPIQLSSNTLLAQKQHLQSIAEQMISTTRTKIQELRLENPDRRLILVGCNSGASLALQVALVEQVSGVVCFGFSYNTVHGIRGAPDDHILDLSTPVLFLVGQNSARTSPEEIECLRERITAPTSLVVVGAADDCLRVSKTKRKFEGVTQEMVDNMVMDEISEFATSCLSRPLPPKTHIKSHTTNGLEQKGINLQPRVMLDSSSIYRKRKASQNVDDNLTKLQKPAIKPTIKFTRPHSTTLSTTASSEATEMAVNSILPNTDPDRKNRQIVTTIGNFSKSTFGFEKRYIATTTKPNPKPKSVPQNQFVQLKPSQGPSNQKIYTIKGPASAPKQLNPTSRPASRQSTPGNSRPSTPTQQFYITSRGQLVNKLVTLKGMPGSSSLSSNDSINTTFSPTKFTIVKSKNQQNPTISNNSSYISESDVTIASDLNDANIFDIPIIYADSDGNIDEDASEGSVVSISSESAVTPTNSKFKTSPIASTSTATSLGKNKNLTIQKTNNKVVILNKGGSPFIATPVTNPGKLPTFKSTLPQPIKFSKLVLANPKAIIDLTGKTVLPTNRSLTSTLAQSSGPRKIEIINNTLLKPGTPPQQHQQQKQQALSYLTVVDGKVNVSRSIPATTSTTITLGSGGGANATRVNNIQQLKPNRIVVKSNSLKPYTPIPGTTPAVMNRGLTVKKVNIVSSARSHSFSTAQSTLAQQLLKDSPAAKLLAKKQQ
ncbi:unnamed protein product [Diamesa tonsa]